MATDNPPSVPLETVSIEVADDKKKLTRAATLKDVGRKSVTAVKENPKKTAGCCSVCCIVIIVLAIVIPLGVAGAAYAYLRYYRFSGDSRTAAVGGAALGGGGRESLIPAQTNAAETTRRRRLQTSTGPLSTCPRDSQAVVEAEATPETVFDGTTIFTTVDQINCLMRLTRPGAPPMINQGPYTATINENTCQPTSQGGGSGGGMGGGEGGGGGQSGGPPPISLKTLGVNSTRPTLANPEEPFQVKLILPFTPPSYTPDQAAANEHLICFHFIGWVFDNVTNTFTDYQLVFASCEPEPEPGSMTGQPGPPSFYVQGQIVVREPDGSVDLAEMHTLVSNSANTQVSCHAASLTRQQPVSARGVCSPV